MTVDVFKERFGYEIEGVWFPRVTSITSLASGFSFLKKSDPLGRRFGFQQAALWGQKIHESIESILKDEELEFDAQIAPSIETFRKWRELDPFVVKDPWSDVEKRVMDVEQGYAGTVDIVAEVEGILSIIDLKTGVAQTRAYGLQTAAYMNAFNKMHVSPTKECKQRWILRLDQYRQCFGCAAKMREKYGRGRITAGKSSRWQLCAHQWSALKGEIDFRELKEYDRDLERFFELKERWEWSNKEWLSHIPNYEKNIRQRTLFV